MPFHTQELRIHAFRWFNHHLKGSEALIDMPAVKFFEPEQLKVFDKLPEDEINTRLDQTVVEVAAPLKEQLARFGWEQQKTHWQQILNDRVFGGWPSLEEQPESEFLEEGKRLPKEELRVRSPSNDVHAHTHTYIHILSELHIL